MQRAAPSFRRFGAITQRSRHHISPASLLFRPPSRRPRAEVGATLEMQAGGGGGTNMDRRRPVAATTPAFEGHRRDSPIPIGSTRRAWTCRPLLLSVRTRFRFAPEFAALVHAAGAA